MQATIKISVIIPCHRTKADLPLALDSLTTQTLPVHEVVIVSDDGDSYDDVRQRYHDTLPITCASTGKVGSGPSNAKNVGLAHCTGELVLILDSDDFIEPDFLERTAPRALAEGACLTPRRPVDFHTYALVQTQAFHKLAEYQNTCSLSMHDYIHFPLGWQTLYRRDMLRTAWDTSLFIDQDLILECHLIEAIGHMPFEYYLGYQYRIRPGSICHSADSAPKAIAEYTHITQQLKAGVMSFSPATTDMLMSFFAERILRINAYIADSKAGALKYEPQVIADILQYPLPQPSAAA